MVAARDSGCQPGARKSFGGVHTRKLPGSLYKGLLEARFGVEASSCQLACLLLPLQVLDNTLQSPMAQSPDQAYTYGLAPMVSLKIDTGIRMLP